MLVFEGRAPTGGRKGPSPVRLLSHPIPSHRLTTTTPSAGGETTRSTSFIYDNGDQLTKYTLPDGIVVTQLFDDERRLTKETKTKGAQSINRSWLYDATVDRMTKHTDWRGEDWVYEYDADGNVTKGKYPTVTSSVPSSRQAITTHSYNSLGVMTKTVDPLGVETHLFRASTGLLTKEIRDAGGLALPRILHYDAGNRLTAAVDALSQTTTYAYDGALLTKTTSPGGAVTESYYDVDGLVTKQIAAAGTSDALTTTRDYDVNGLVTKQTVDPSGLALATEFYYNNNGARTRVKYPDGNFGPALTYDPMGRLSQEVLGSLSKRYEYDAAGRLSRVAYATQGAMGPLWNNHLVEHRFDGLGRRTKSTDALNHYSTFEVDVAGNVTKQLSYQSGATLLADVRSYFDEAGRNYKTERMLDGTTASTTKFVRDVAGRVTKQTDPLSNDTQLAYDALGRVTRTTDPLSKTADQSYDALGRVTKRTDALSNSTETYFDSDGQVTKSVDALSNAATFTYNSLGRVTRTTDPLSNNTDTLYDSASRMTKTTDPAGGETTTGYDAASRKTKVTVKVTATTSRSTTFEYDDVGQLTRTTDPLSNNTDQSYDMWGRVVTLTDAEANDIQYSYDLKGQRTLTSKEDPIPLDMMEEDRVDVKTEYDGLGRRTRVLNDNNTAVLRWQYDRLGRLTKLQYANNDAETYLYDIAGRRTKLTRPTTELVTYLYDARGGLTKTTLPGSVNQVYNYDAAGRRTHADDPDSDLDWHVDAAGRITKVVDGKLSKTILYTYDAAGRRTSLDGPEASDTQAWSFDAVGRTTKITENSNDRAEWLYDLAGGRTKLTYGSGSYGTWDYDASGRLTNLVHKKSGGTVIQSFAYVLDKVGNRTKLTLNGGDYVEYLYDPLYQLTKEHRKTSGGSTQYRNDFYYDYISNRTKLVYNDGTSDTTTTYSYSTADQLTKETTGGTDTTYTYDANGNRTKKDDGTTTEEYHYDARNLLTKYTDATTTATYTFDIENRRIKTIVGATTTRYLYDGFDVLGEYDGSATPALQANYVTSSLDQYVSVVRNGSLYYYHQDSLGSVWNLSRASDEVVQNTYHYQGFGSTYDTVTENVTNPYRFTGRVWDSDSSLHHYRARMYDQSQGRFVSRDPITNLVLPGAIKVEPMVVRRRSVRVLRRSSV